MKFRLLLWFMARMMKKAAKKSAAFRNELKGRDFVFQIQTEDNKVVRQYTVSENQIRSKSKAHDDPAFTIEFKDALAGLRILTSKDKNAFMRGIQDRDLTLYGDLSLVLWFQGIARYLKP